MTYEKIVLVIIFLGVLVAIQLYLYNRYRNNPQKQASITGLRVLSRLALSKNSQVNVVSTGKETFLIVSSKNAPASIITLTPQTATHGVESRFDASE